MEIFEGVDRKAYFTAQWFFRAEDTVSLNSNFPYATNIKGCIQSKFEVVEAISNSDYEYDEPNRASFVRH